MLGVYDTQGKNVFQNTDEKRSPAYIYIALPPESDSLLKKIEGLKIYEAVIETIPTSEGIKDEPGELQLVSEDIANFINRNTAGNY